MSANSSDSESNSWAVVSKEDVEGSDDSSGSSDFVQLENTESVSYHHSRPEENGICGGDGPSEETSDRTEATPQQSPHTELKFVLHLKEHALSDEEDDDSESRMENAVHESPDISAGSDETYTLKSNSCSSIEELAAHETTEQVEDETPESTTSSMEIVDATGIQDPGENTHNSLGFTEARRRKSTNESDSDHSDFVRLDPSMVEESHGDLMRLSAMSSTSNASSLSSSFRFIHRSGMVLGADEYMKRRFFHDNDDESVQSDIDDRCESDISGVADDDMSSYSLGDLPISAGDVVRSYKHRPNNNLNRILTTLALVVLFGAVGIGVGHFLGTRSEARLRLQQVEKMKSLTDDYLMCLQHQEDLEEKLNNGEEQRLIALANEWKEQYEELVAERVQLEQQIMSLEQHLNEEQQKSRKMRGEMMTQGKELAHLAEDLEHSHQAQLLENQKQAETAITELRNEVNVLRTENDDLKSSLTKMRYNTYPAAQGLQELAKTAGLKQEVNELVHENSHLKKEVGKLRYTQHPGNPTVEVLPSTGDLATQPHPDVSPYVVTAPEIMKSNEEESVGESQASFEELEELKQKLADTREKLETAQAKADMWQSLFQVESERATKAEGNAPSVLSCLQTMFPEVTLDDLTQMSRDTLGNVTEFLNNQLHFVQNITKDQSFSELLKRKWSHLQDLFDSPTVKGASDKARAVYDDLHESINRKFQEFKSYSGFSEKPESKEDQTEEKEEEKPKPESRFDKAINKTKETVEKLTQKINETWNQVKDIPSQLAETFAPGVSRKVEKFAERVNAGWQRVHNKVNAGWEKVRNKVENGWFKKEHPQHHQEKKERHHKYRHAFDSTVDARKQYHGDPYWNSATDEFDDTFTQPSDRGNFENKPDHNQKKATTHADKRYEEFWDAVGFDPDDIFHEGFFEGNDRKWRKHQKTLRKLHGRIQKLNEDILYDMDDDDIEDLYDDLEDFEEELNPETQPMTLKTWLSCQIRWWKSRFQRKHRDEYLIQGCGRQLMHWQMKASCSAKCKSKKGCGKQVNKSPACQHFLSGSVIKTVAKPRNSKPYQNNKNSFEKNENGKSRKNKETIERFDPEIPIPAYNIVNFTTFLDEGIGERISDKTGENDQSRDKKGGATSDEDTPEWLYERARDLDYRTHKTDWVYRRANERDFHRRRPSDWYHERAEAREHKHNELIGKQ